MRRSIFFLAVVLFVCSVAGCSSAPEATHPVRGVVRFPDGEPVMTGTIELTNVTQPFTARGAIGRNGEFTLGTFTDSDGAVAGKYDAVVIQFFAAERSPGVVHNHGDVVDPKFASYQTSPLRFEIKPGDNQLEVTVERKQP